MLIISSVALVPYLGIELIQLNQQRTKYLKQGWNIIDILNIVFFYMIVIMHFCPKAVYLKYFQKEIKVFVELFTFLKLISLAQIVDSFRSFTLMFRESMWQSMTFTYVYVGFVLCFATGYIALDVDTLGHHKQLRGLGRFCRLVFSQWRSYLFYIDFPRWRKWGTATEEFKQKPSNNFHMKFIWIYFFIVMLFMTTIMLNFMIAVIMDTYDDVTQIEDRYKYQGRADLNRDHY